MLDERAATVACIVLIEDADAAAAVAGAMENLALPEHGVSILEPPVRGVSFFADQARQPTIDAWWSDNVAAQTEPIYLLDGHRGDLSWLDGVDGRCYVLARDAAVDAATLPACVRAVAARTPMEFAARVMLDLAAERDLFDGDAARRLLALTSSRSGAADGVLGLAPAASAGGVDDTPPSTPFPFELLAAMPRVAVSATPATAALPRQQTGRARGLARLRLPALQALGFSRWPPRDDGALAAQLLRSGSTIVAVGSRKGGVGKTSHAAGMSIVAGSLLDGVGHRAVIIDANVANPDAWGVLNLPPGAATVRDTLAALAASTQPPRPVHASTPALACYPEARETTEYSRIDVHLFASYARRHYTLIVVDMSNRLPDPTGGPDAAAAAYWLEVADVLVLPTAASKQDYNGVLDYLEVPDLPPTILAHIVPRSRRNREHPLARQYLATIEQHVERIVALPDEAEHVRYAGLEGLPVDSVSRRLRTAYRDLLEAVADVAGNRGDETAQT